MNVDPHSAQEARLKTRAARLLLAILLSLPLPVVAQPDSTVTLLPYYLSLARSSWPSEPHGAVMGALGLRWPEGPGWPVTSLYWPPNRPQLLLAWGRIPGTELDPVDARACLLDPDGTVRWNHPISLDRDPVISDDLVTCFVEEQSIDSMTAFGRPVFDGRFITTWLDSTGAELGTWALRQRDAFGVGTYAIFSGYAFRPGATDMLFLERRLLQWERMRATSIGADVQTLISVSFDGRENWRAHLEPLYDGIMMSASGNVIALIGFERLPERDSEYDEFNRLDVAFLDPGGHVLATATDGGSRHEWTAIVDPRGDRFFYYLEHEVCSIDVAAGGVSVPPDSVRLRELCAYPDSAVASASRTLLRYFRAK